MKDSKKVATGFLWRFAERIGAQGVKFLVELILARLLLPDDYGIVALATVFITILNVFVDSGLGSALVQKKNADDLDFSSVFYVSIVMCLFLYALVFFTAPWIAAFYAMPDLTPVIRVLGLTVVISSVKNIQQAYVSRNMLFKEFFYATLSGTIGAAVIGIWMAYHGFGVWALVAQHLFNLTLDTAFLWVTIQWRPKRCFSWQRLRKLFSYGWKMLASTLLDTGYNNLRQLIIGKLYTADDLAFYNRGDQFPHMLVNNINGSIDSVLLPSMASEQDDRTRVRAMTRRAIRVSTYLVMPAMTGLAVCAKPIICLFLTEKWLPCVPFLQIFCFGYAFHPIHTTNLSAIQAMGRSDLFLKLEIVKKVVGLIVLLITMQFGVMAMALSTLYMSFIGQIINSWPNRRLLDYSYAEQFKDMMPQIGLSLGMGTIVYAVGMVLPLNDWQMLLVQVPLGVAVYLAGSVLFKLESFQYLWAMAKRTLKKA